MTIENLQGKNWFVPHADIKYEKSDNIAKDAAKLIAKGNVIAWFQGGSEFGPRALGNRSILADPRSETIKDTINQKVKNRQWFRPFAPSILKEEAGNYFELCDDSPFMLLVAKVKEDKKNLIPAVVHVDNTARVQTVTKQNNGIYYDLIYEFDKITGIPVVLNTSFNVVLEPIVETPADALACFLKTNIDYLVINNFIVEKIKD